MQNNVKNSLEITFGKKVRTEENGKTLKLNVNTLDKVNVFQLGQIVNVEAKNIHSFDIKRSGKGLVIVVKLN